MAYIGKSPTGTGVRSRYHYTAAGAETSLSGADDNNKTLTFTDGEYVDVYVNGVLLFDGDYNTNTANTISGLSALVADDVVEVVVYDVFTVADTVSAKNGGTFSGDVTVDGAFTSQGIDDNATSTAMTLDSSGNLMVGKSTIASGLTTAGFDVLNGNYMTMTNDSGVAARFSRLTNDGDLIQFNKGSTLFGRINTSGQILTKSEGGTNNIVDLRQGSAKHWINLNASTASISDSHNVTSITDNGVGRFTVTINNDYNNANWSSQVNGGVNGSVRISYGNFEDDQYTGSVKIVAYRESPAAYVDPVDFMNDGHGDLA